MGIRYALGNVLLAAQEYANWPEVMAAIIKKQEPAKVVLRDGVRIEASVGLRFLVREIFFEGIYNPVDFAIGDNDIVVDIGANCGVFTLYAASHTRNNVYAFEPSPENFLLLQHNIAANNFQHVIACRCAVSDKVGTTKLCLNPADGQQNLLSEHVIPEKIEQYKTRSDLDYLTTCPVQTALHIEVPTTTLQEIMLTYKLARIDFLKLDCEGTEGTILSATPREYLARVRKIALEFHDHLSVFNHEDLQKLLEEAGFVTRIVWDHRSPLGYIYGLQVE